MGAALCIGQMLFGSSLSSRAAIVMTGDVSPSDPANWTISTGGNIGVHSTGAVTVDSGSVLQSEATGIGYYSGSQGTATVTGIGSKLTSLGLSVGSSGSGALNIQAGGLVTGYNHFLGYNPGSTGVATVIGTNSLWTISYNLLVAYNGNGTLNIGTISDSGGLVKAKELVLSYGSNSSGTCNINQGGTLQVGTMSKGSGAADFYWNDGTIQNYDSNTNLTVSSANNLILKLSSTGTHAVNINAGRIGTIDAMLSDATSGGTLTKQGQGILTLTASNTYSGKTTVEAGRFRVTGSILNTSGMDIAAWASLELANATGSATAPTLAIANNGTVLISAGSQTVGAISGTGVTQVKSSATLTATSIVQNSLTIGVTGAGSAAIPEQPALNQVPEPRTLLLFIMAVVGAIVFSRYRS